MADEDESAGATRLDNERRVTRRLLVSAQIAPCSETPFLAVRHACEVVERDGTWRESYAPDCWLVNGDGAKVTLGHDGTPIGSVARCSSIAPGTLPSCRSKSRPSSASCSGSGSPSRAGATRRLIVSARIAPCSQTERLRVRHGLEIVDPDDCQTWRESFAPGAFLARATPAPVTLRHDGPTIGHVTVVTDFREWHIADMLIEAEDELLERMKIGTPVSIDARSVKRDNDDDLRIRRHTLVRLDAVAILGAGEIPYYQHAKITDVRELAERAAGESEVIETRGVIRREGGVVLGVR